jgi:hypothetical protein
MESVTMETGISLSDDLSVDVVKVNTNTGIDVSICLKRGVAKLEIVMSETLWDRIAQSVSAELSSEPEPQ